MLVTRWIVPVLMLAVVLSGCKSASDEPPASGVAIESMHETVQADGNASDATSDDRKLKIIRRFAVDELPELVKENELRGMKAGFDTKLSSDGNGSLRLVSEHDDFHAVPIYRVERMDLSVKEPSRLAFRARIMTRDLNGNVYLKLSTFKHGEIHPKADGMANGFQTTTFPEWTQKQTADIIRPGETVGQVEMTVVLDGTGTVWVDDVELFTMPLPETGQGDGISG